MSASDRVVVVLGGAGTVGSGIVKSLLERGFQVAVISRDGNRLERLRSFVPAATRDRLHTLVGDVGSEEGAEAAKGALLKSVGKVTDVVSSLGFSWWQGGPPHTQTLQELHRVLETLLLSTFTAWKAFFPLVRENPGGSYTFITGGAGERLLMPGTGFLTLGAAGALAFCQVVREEYPDVPCKLNEVKINMGVATPERAGPGYVSHLQVGEAVASLVEKRRVSHAVLCASSPADLQTLTLEGKI
ncbi:peroxisomal trans-2-enoyl-CoA reductase-like isoform X1 [Emydura macquarii macquarii]|uniref:peroxisomal trans-2-enoyl-CoA reductase-like isoform X1 n=1 Tax=Emydura macquarii macquarii TaxID=1129001 RepID=UPI00352BC795